MDVLSSTPVTLWVDFEAPQGLVIPDVGSVTYSLYDGAGVPLAIAQALTPAADATGVSIAINAVHHVIAPDRSFERRQAVVSWTAGGRSYQKRAAYRVIEMPLHSVTPADVRTYLALSEGELPDAEVDLFAASLIVEEVVGRERFEEALSAGTTRELRAARAIVLTAAAQLFPALRYRIAQSKTDGTLKFDRLRDPAAFEGLVRATADELQGVMQGLTGDVSVNEVAPVLIQLTTIAIDPVTGSAPATAVGG